MSTVSAYHHGRAQSTTWPQDPGDLGDGAFQVVDVLQGHVRHSQVRGAVGQWQPDGVGDHHRLRLRVSAHGSRQCGGGVNAEDAVAAGSQHTQQPSLAAADIQS